MISVPYCVFRGGWSGEGVFLCTCVRVYLCTCVPKRKRGESHENEEREEQSAKIIAENAQRGEYPEEPAPEEQADGAGQGVAAIRERGEEAEDQREGQPAEEGGGEVPGYCFSHQCSVISKW